MRWGVKKKSSSSSAPAAPDSADHTSSRALKTKKPRQMSSSELKTLNGRLQLEKSYSDLQKHSSKVDKGHTQVKRILAIGATVQLAYAFAKSPLGKGIRTGVTAALIASNKGGSHKAWPATGKHA